MRRRCQPLLLLDAVKQPITESSPEIRHKHKYEMQPSRQPKFESHPLSSSPALPRFEGTILAHSRIETESTFPCRILQRWYSTTRRPVVAVGMSGGVDSSVAALLLKRQVKFLVSPVTLQSMNVVASDNDLESELAAKSHLHSGDM